jgi:hypothetical protein
VNAAWQRGEECDVNPAWRYSSYGRSSAALMPNARQEPPPSGSPVHVISGRSHMLTCTIHDGHGTVRRAHWMSADGRGRSEGGLCEPCVHMALWGDRTE